MPPKISPRRIARNTSLRIVLAKNSIINEFLLGMGKRNCMI